METRIYNDYSISEQDVDNRIIRVKALIINSKQELLVGYSHDTYQFIGGHIEKNEDMLEGLKREIEEESGIILKDEVIRPFFLRKKYLKNYPTDNTNSCYEYYYYTINTDRLPDLEKVNYTKDEKNGNFELQYISINDIEKTFKDNMKVSEKTKIIEEENLEAIEIYKNL